MAPAPKPALLPNTCKISVAADDFSHFPLRQYLLWHFFRLPVSCCYSRKKRGKLMSGKKKIGIMAYGHVVGHAVLSHSERVFTQT